jgi:hypothetical protein
MSGDGTDLGIEALYGLKNGAQLIDESLRQEPMRRDDRNVLREWRGRLDAC